MAGNLGPDLAARISLDDMGTVNSLRGLRNQVSALMNSWKAQNAMLESAEDHLGAAKAKYDGLGDAIKKQEEYIGALKARQSELDTSTTKGAEAFARLQKQVATATKQYASLEAQQKRAATSVDYYANGINKVKGALKEVTTSSNLMVERLQAQGKTYQANYEKARLYAVQLDKMGELYTKQKAQLNTIAEEQGKDSSAYHKAQSSLEELATQMAKTEAKQKELDKSFSNTNIHVAKMRDSYDKVSSSVKSLGGHLKEGVGKVASAATTAVATVGALGAGFVKASKSASDLQSEYTKTANLLETGGEKTKDVTKAVAEMQKQGRDMSLEYGISQQKIADAYNELVHRGDTSKQALGSMNEEVKASVATGDDLSDVVKITSSAMESFGMKVNNTTQMVKNSKEATNELAFAADKTSTSFADIGVGMSYVGATAHQAGFSLSETASAMGILSNSGLEADKAGTGLRKVLNSLITSVKSIDKKDSVLAKLGIKKSDLVDSNGQLKNLSTIMGVINEHTKNMSKTDKGAIFNSLFGTTGQQAGEILAENTKKLQQLDQEAQDASKHDYVGKLAEKNMNTAEGAMNRFKMAAQDVEMTLAAKMLPTVTTVAHDFAQLADTKGFQESVQGIGDGLAAIGKKATGLMDYIDEHQKDISGITNSLGTIIGELASGAWSTFKNTIKGISDAVLAMFHEKSTGSALKDLNKALKDIASHKQEIKDVGGFLAAMFITSKALKFAKALGSVGSSIHDVYKAIDSTKGGNFLNHLFGLSDKEKVKKKVINDADDIADSTVKDVEGKKPKDSFISKLFKASDKSSVKNSATKDAEDIAGSVEDATTKSTGKVNVFKQMFAKTPVAEQSAVSAGARVAGKAVSALNVGISAFDISKAFFEKGTKKYEDAGKGIGGLVGAALGSTLGPIGSAVGGTVGSLIGQGIGHVIGKNGGFKKVAENFDHWGHQIAKNTYYWTKQNGKTIDSMMNNIQKGVSSLGKTVSKRWNGLWTGLGKDVKNAGKTIGSNWNSIWSGIHKSFNSMSKTLSKNWSSFWDGLGNSIKKTNIVKTATDAWNSMKQGIDKAQQGMTKSVNDGKNKREGLTKSEADTEISTANRQYKDVVNYANQKYFETVQAASKKHNDVIAEANKEYYQDGTISKQQHDDVVYQADLTYKKAVDSARLQKEKTIMHAQEEHEKVVREANKQAEEHQSAAKGESTDVNKAYNHMVDRMADIYNGIADGLNSILKKIDNKDKTIPHWHPKHYATGTAGVGNGELAVVGEEGFEIARDDNGIYPVGLNGEEMRFLKPGTQILPHNLSKQFTALAAGLPHYKKGKDKDNFIKDAAKWVKGKIDDVGKIISEGADKVVKSLFHSLGWDSLYKAMTSDLTQYTIEGTGKQIKDAAIDKLNSLFGKYEDAHGGGAGVSYGNANNPGGAGVQRWAPVIDDAAKQMGVSLADWQKQKLLRQIATESGGNPTIPQQISDQNSAAGHPAFGLLQFVPSTFASWSLPGHNNIASGEDQIMAAINALNHGGEGGWGNIGDGHGWRNGGLVLSHQFGEIGEEGPEMVIPLTPLRRSRGYELLGKVVSMFASEDHSNQSISTTSDDRVEQLLAQNNELMKMLINIASGQLNEMKNGKAPTNEKVMRGAFYNAFGTDQRINTYGQI